MNLNLENKRALVLGASSGLGFCVAKTLAREGARTVISSSDEKRITEAAKNIKQETNRAAIPFKADFSNKTEISNLIEKTLEALGGIDLLFTNTGGPPPGYFMDFGDDDWQNAFETQLLYLVRVLKLVIPIMQKEEGGRIVNNTSISVKEPIDNLLFSNVFRAGVAGLSKTLANQYAKDNIIINCTAPGYTKTERLKSLFDARAAAQGRTPAEIERQITSGIPLGRIPEPEEFAEVVAFLLSERSSAVSGAIITIDGGVTKCLF